MRVSILVLLSLVMVFSFLAVGCGPSVPVTSDSSTYNDPATGETQERSSLRFGQEAPVMGEQPAAPSALLGINTATAAQFAELPGVTPDLAQAMVDYRARWGAYESIEDLKNVPGMTLTIYTEIYGKVRVD